MTFFTLAKDRVVTSSNLPRETVENLYHIDRITTQTTHVDRQIDIHYQPPRFEKPLPDVTNLREGDGVHLETKVTPSSDPNLVIEWYKDNIPLRASNRVRTISEFGFVILEISPVQHEDSGVYTVRAHNEVGEAFLTSNVICKESKSIIYDSPFLQDRARFDSSELVDSNLQQKPRFLSKLNDIYIKENEFVHMESRLLPVGDSTMKVEWFIDGKPFTTGSRFRTINDFGYVVLEIVEAYARDSGVYECRATNQFGEDSISCRLNVEGAKTIILDSQLPIEHSRNIQILERRISREPKKPVEEESQPLKPRFYGQVETVISRTEGDALHIEARVEPSNDPELKIEWFLNDQPLAPGSRIHTVNDFGFVVLEIDWLFDRDTGRYKCVATNQYGSDTFEFILNVQSKTSIILDSQFQPQVAEQHKFSSPHFVIPLQPQHTLNEGDNIHFESRIEPFGDGEMTVEWFHNDEPLKSGHRHKTINDFGYVSLDIISLNSEVSKI